MTTRAGACLAALLAVSAAVAAATVAAAADDPLDSLGFSQGRRPIDVGPPPVGLAGTSADACVDCHAEIGAEWRQSQHRSAASDEHFRAGYRMNPLQFCVNCHAPLSRPDGANRAAALAGGVSCSACHVRAGAVLARRITEAGQRAHPMRREPLLGDSALCSGCHQFRFPDPSMVSRLAFDPAEQMQMTFSEWQASPAAKAGVGCQDCHMPWVGTGSRRHRSHRFVGVADRAFVAQAIDVTARARWSDGQIDVRVTIDPHGVGHAVPTGDMFRRARVSVWPEHRPELGRHKLLGRWFTTQRVRVGDQTRLLRRAGRDNRLQPGDGPREFAFRLPGDRATRVRYRFELLRMTERMARRQNLDPASIRIPVADGVVSVSAR